MDDGDEDAPPLKRQRMTRQTTTENKSGKNDENAKDKNKNDSNDCKNDSNDRKEIDDGNHPVNLASTVAQAVAAVTVVVTVKWDQHQVQRATVIMNVQTTQIKEIWE